MIYGFWWCCKVVSYWFVLVFDDTQTLCPMFGP